MLGKYDLTSYVKKEQYDRVNNQEEDDISKMKRCVCCAFIRQDQPLELCEDSFDDLSNIGISIYMYFKTIIRLIALLLVVFAIFSIFSAITNYIAYQSDANASLKMGTLASYGLSVGPKIFTDNWRNNVYFSTQCWLGVIVIIVWVAVILIIRKRNLTG